MGLSERFNSFNVWTTPVLLIETFCWSQKYFCSYFVTEMLFRISSLRAFHVEFTNSCFLEGGRGRKGGWYGCASFPRTFVVHPRFFSVAWLYVFQCEKVGKLHVSLGSIRDKALGKQKLPHKIFFVQTKHFPRALCKLSAEKKITSKVVKSQRGRRKQRSKNSPACVAGAGTMDAVLHGGRDRPI